MSHQNNLTTGSVRFIRLDTILPDDVILLMIGLIKRSGYKLGMAIKFIAIIFVIDQKYFMAHFYLNCQPNVVFGNMWGGGRCRDIGL